jgi:hypothetical protein
MRKILNGRRPSPALVISIIALVLAVGGGSVALAISDNAQDRKIAKGVAKNLVGASHPFAKAVPEPTTGENTRTLFKVGPFTFKGVCLSTGESRADVKTSKRATIEGSDGSNDNAPPGTTVARVTTNGTSPDPSDNVFVDANHGPALQVSGPVGWNAGQFRGDTNNCHFEGLWRFIHK